MSATTIIGGTSSGGHGMFNNLTNTLQSTMQESNEKVHEINTTIDMVCKRNGPNSTVCRKVSKYRVSAFASSCGFIFLLFLLMFYSIYKFNQMHNITNGFITPINKFIVESNHTSYEGAILFFELLNHYMFATGADNEDQTKGIYQNFKHMYDKMKETHAVIFFNDETGKQVAEIPILLDKVSLAKETLQKLSQNHQVYVLEQHLEKLPNDILITYIYTNSTSSAVKDIVKAFTIVMNAAAVGH